MKKTIKANKAFSKAFLTKNQKGDEGANKLTVPSTRNKTLSTTNQNISKNIYTRNKRPLAPSSTAKCPAT